MGVEAASREMKKRQRDRETQRKECKSATSKLRRASKQCSSCNLWRRHCRAVVNASSCASTCNCCKPQPCWNESTIKLLYKLVACSVCTYTLLYTSTHRTTFPFKIFQTISIRLSSIFPAISGLHTDRDLMRHFRNDLPGFVYGKSSSWFLNLVNEMRLQTYCCVWIYGICKLLQCTNKTRLTNKTMKWNIKTHINIFPIFGYCLIYQAS